MKRIQVVRVIFIHSRVRCDKIFINERFETCEAWGDIIKAKQANHGHERWATSVVDRVRE